MTTHLGMASAVIVLIAAIDFMPPLTPTQGSGGNLVTLHPGSLHTGMFTPDLPLDNDKPYIDFDLEIDTADRYRIDLESHDSSRYDPYLFLYSSGGQQIAADDDGGPRPLDSQIQMFLQPGSYRLRVSMFGMGPISAATGYTVRVNHAP